MEEILDLYTQPYDPKRPLICMDETSKQLVRETRTPLALRPGQPAKYDYEYQREGVCNLFLFFEPLRGWRMVDIRAQRTKQDWVYEMKKLVETYYPEAEVIRVVLDNLNTHNPAAFYEFFAPAEAKPLLDRLEFHYTPKHASWLNMAEIELSVISRQCLKQRIPTQQQVQKEVRAWAQIRNEQCKTVDWHFTTAEARQRLKHLYPSYSE
jgi:hypothetical protein